MIKVIFLNEDLPRNPILTRIERQNQRIRYMVQEISDNDEDFVRLYNHIRRFLNTFKVIAHHKYKTPYSLFFETLKCPSMYKNSTMQTLPKFE